MTHVWRVLGEGVGEGESEGGCVGVGDDVEGFG